MNQSKKRFYLTQLIKEIKNALKDAKEEAEVKIPLNPPFSKGETIHRECLLGSEDSTHHQSNNTITAAPMNKIPSKSRILLVEDSGVAAYVAKSILSRLNCVVEIAEEGQTAVRLAAEKPFHLIFMDIGLPDIDGYQATRRIRLNELNKHTPIVALTAH